MSFGHTVKRTDSAESIVQKWHDENHQYAFEQCDLQPCHAIVHRRGPGTRTSWVLIGGGGPGR